jgi:aryl-alcohol dehydrogenase-like predicted oxidoreductase
MGCDNQPNFPHAAVMFDDFFARGGNAFDTAFIYGGGRHEHLLGEWMRLRGVREQVVVIVKGGHTPYCTPTDLTTQLRSASSGSRSTAPISTCCTATTSKCPWASLWTC